LHVSRVHGLLSLQCALVEHEHVAGSCTEQTPSGPHVPSGATPPHCDASAFNVHRLPSTLDTRSTGHSALRPSQRSAASHTADDAARHTVPLAANASFGHAAAPPVQRSASSHAPAASRHCTPLGLKVSFGQDAAPPVQRSSSSHAPLAARHTAPAGWNVSAGHDSAEPVHVSGASHGPTGARHTVPAG
jgi:hypothetical protein